MKMRKIMALVLGATMAFALTACGSSAPAAPAAPAAAAESKEAEAPAAAPAADADYPTPENPITLKIHTDYTEGHPVVDELEAFAARVEEGTEGAVKLKIYPNCELGDYETVWGEVAQGTIDMTWGTTGVSYGEKFNVINWPMMASSWDEAHEIFAPGSYISDYLADACDDIGIKLLSLHMVGAGCMGTTKPVQNFDTYGADKGLLIRAANTPVIMEPIKAMGFRVQGINWSECFTALQTGVVDGMVGGHPPVMYEQFRDVVKYIYQINNFFEMGTVAINADTFNKLSPEQQAVLQEAAEWEFEQSYTLGTANEGKYLDLLADSGIEVTIPSEEWLTDTANHIRAEVWPQIAADLNDEEFVNTVTEMLVK